MFSIIKKYKRDLNNICKIREKGVSLISLIVIIIVLLILAAVTIKISSGDSGLIKKTKKGVAMYQNASVNESETLNEYSRKLKTFVEVPKATTIKFTADIVGWTTKDVTVTATSDDPDYEIELKSEDSDWSVRKDNKITVSKNQQINARLKNLVDKYSEDVATYNVTNIDKDAPDKTAPALKATTNSITVTFKQKDDGSGIAKREYSIDNGSTWKEGDSVFTFNGLTQGKKYEIITRATDRVENQSISDASYITTETIPKLVVGSNLTFTPSTSSWTNSNVSVEVSTTVKGYTLQTSTDGKTWGTTNPLTYSANGTAYARLWDGNNASAVATTNITNIDKLAPTNTAPTVATTTNKITITNKQVDQNAANGSGKSDLNSSKTQYRLVTDTNGTTAVTGKDWQSSNVFSGLTQNTTYYVQTKVTDNAGNTTTSAVATAKTTSVPTPTAGANVIFTPSTSNWTNGNVTVTVSTTITGFTLQTSTDGKTWGTTNPLTYTANGTAYARLWDGNNASAVATTNITNIDKLAPTNTAPTVATTTNKITATLKQVDQNAANGSGKSDLNASKTQYRLVTDTNGTTAVTGKDWQSSNVFSGLTQNTTYYVQTKVTDNAGNTTISAVATAKTAIVPSGTTSGVITLTPDHNTWTNTDVKVTATTNQTGYTIQMSTDGKTFTDGTSKTLTSNGTVYARLRDSSNNYGASATISISIIDKVAPTLNISKETYQEGFNNWTLPDGGSIDNNILTLTKDGAAMSYYYKTGNERWWITLDGYTNKESTTHDSAVGSAGKGNGGIYLTSYYFDNAFKSTVSQNSYSSNGWAPQLPINTWSNDFTWSGYEGYGGKIEYVKIFTTTGNEYSQPTVKYRNFKMHGQLYSNFYLINQTNSDDSSKVKVIKYALGNQTVDYFKTAGTATTDGQIRVTSNGTYTVYVQDNAGNDTIKTITIDKIDTTAPTTVAPILSTTTNKITVTSKQTDGESGVLRTQYAIKESGGNYGNWQDSNSFEKLKQGTKYVVKTRTTNNAGLSSESEETTVTTGTIPGLTTGSNLTFTATPSGWTNGNVSVKVSTTVTGYTLQTSTDGKSWGTTNPLTYSANGTAYARLWDGNNASAVATTNITNIDKTAPTKPTYKAFFDDGKTTYTSGTWTNQQVKTDISSTDANSGINRIEYSFDKNSWTKFQFELSNGLHQNGTTYTGTESWGIYDNRNDTVYFRAIDNAGNISEIFDSFNIRYDISTPTTTAPAATTTTNSITITNRQADSGTGIASIQYQIKKNGTSTWGSLQSGATFGGLTQNTKYDVRTHAVDKAGNASDSAVTTVTTGTIPTPVRGSNLTFTATPSGWTNGNVTVKVTTTITGYTLQTSTNGSTWGTTNPLTFSQNGTAYARLWDGTNASSVATLNVTNIDKLAPNNTAPTAGSVTKNSITVNVNQTDATGTSSYGNSGIKSSETRYAIKKSSSSTWGAWQSSNVFTGLESETSYDVKTKVTDNAGNSKESNVSTVKTAVDVLPGSTILRKNAPKISVSGRKYADLDGDGTADGIIVADISKDSTDGSTYASGNPWGTDRPNRDLGKFSYEKVTSGLREYSENANYKYTNADGSTVNGTLIKCTNNTGIPRYYVISLANYDNNKHYWYKNARKNMRRFSSFTSGVFGKGKENTEKMIDVIRNHSNYNPDLGEATTGTNADIWCIIDDKVKEGWFVPSLAEWAAFASYMGNGSGVYWTSTDNDRYRGRGIYCNISSIYNDELVC